MRISINAAERSLATLAVDLGDKKCEQARTALEELHVDDMDVSILQGAIGEIRRAIADVKQREFDWDFTQRRALAICLRIYRDQLIKLSDKEAKLIVQNDSTQEKISDIGDFLTRLAGQESFWHAEDDDEEDDGTEIKREREDTNDLWDADDEEEQQRPPAERSPALDFPCTACGALADVPCTTGSGVTRTIPHAPRLKAAEKAAKQRAKMAGV